MLTSAAPASRPSAEPAAPSPSLRWLQAPLAWIYTDTLANVSRPKLLFTVALADLSSVYAAAYLAAGEPTRPAALWLFAISAAVLVMLNRCWSYTIASLADAGLQAAKAASACTAVFITAATAFIFGPSVWAFANMVFDTLNI